MRAVLLLAVLVSGIAFYTNESYAELDTDIRLTLETPTSRSTQGGISAVRGWVFHPTKTVEAVEIYIDGVFASSVPVGGLRLDVGFAFPDVPDARFSGWGQTINWKELEAGEHILEVVAFTSDGDFNSQEIELCTAKFDSAFIRDYDDVDLGTMDSIHVWQRRMIMTNIFMEGKYWNVEFSWDQGLQQMQISQITPSAPITNTQSYPCGSPMSFGLSVDDTDGTVLLFED